MIMTSSSGGWTELCDVDDFTMNGDVQRRCGNVDCGRLCGVVGVCCAYGLHARMSTAVMHTPGGVSVHVKSATNQR